MDKLLDKIAIAELDPKKSYIIEVDSDITPEQTHTIKEIFQEKLGITNIVIYNKGLLQITEVMEEE